MEEGKIEVKTVAPEAKKVEVKTPESPEAEAKTGKEHVIYDGESVAVSARMTEEEFNAIREKADEKKQFLVSDPLQQIYDIP